MMEAGRETNVIECECGESTSLDVLNDVQKAYEHRMDLLERMPKSKRMPMQVSVLKQWVSDLGAQNSLLARAVSDLESEASSRLLLEQRKNNEVVCELRAELAVLRRRLARKDSDLRGLVEVLRRLRDLDYCSLDGIHFFEVTESDIFGNCDWNPKTLAQGDLRHNLKHNSARMKNNAKNNDFDCALDLKFANHKICTNCRFARDKRSVICGEVNEMKMLNETLRKENCAKDREIRKLHKDAQQYEQTIKSLRSEISLCKYQPPDCAKKDVEVMAGSCCTGAECGDWAPVKDINSVLREEMLHYQERIQKMESNLKASGDDVRALRKANVGLREELHAVRGACAAIGEQARAAALRGQFKDEIIREMRRQLKHAKAKEITRNASTCTCNIILPVCASTPNCSQRSLVDCCHDISIIETTCPPPSVVISHDCSDLDEEVILQCSLCNSSSSTCEAAACCDRLNSTCYLASTRPKTNPNETTNSCPSTVDFAKEWLTNKSGELKDKIHNLIFSESKSCQSKRVDFTSSCDLRLEPSPCQSIKSCSQDCDEPCEQCELEVDLTACQAAKSISYFEIAGKLCELCKHVLDPAPGQQVNPCGHVDIADQLCDSCKPILDCAPCHSNPCKYCNVADVFCKRCKYLTVSSRQPPKRISYIDIAQKLCQLCKHVLDPAPCQPVKSCRNTAIASKLCGKCKHIFDSEPCEVDTSCKHCDISNKLCKQCKKILDSEPCQSEKPCKMFDIVDKVCSLCKLVLDPVPCQTDTPCKHCDITKKLCKGCKRIVNSTSCQTDKSCKNSAIANKLCENCKNMFNSAPCPTVKSCKILDITDKLCDLCRHVIDPTPCLVKSCKHIKDPAPSKSANPCKHCDVSKKLCKECKRIFDCYSDRSCKNVDISEMLCEQCKAIYNSAPCQNLKPCLKHVKLEKSCEECTFSIEPAQYKPSDPCKNCDITNKLCKQCKSIFNSAPCSDRSCKNANTANKLCENCKHIYDAAPCRSIESYKKHFDIAGKSYCRPVKPCKKCDISKKLCKDCKRIFDSVPCVDRSCQNLDIVKELCDNCRHIYAQSIKSSKKHVDSTDEPCDKCKIALNPATSSSDNTCKRCDVTKKLCKGCKHVFNSIPCIDRSCQNIDIANKLCKNCKHLYASAPCQFESNKVETSKKPCKLECSDLDSALSKSAKSCKTDVGKSCERCKHVPNSILNQCDKSNTHVSVQVPEQRMGSKKFEELFFNDQAAGNSSMELWESGKCACALESQSEATLTTFCPIKQEAKSTSFDVAKESICRSRGSSPESPGSSCASARARHYQNKLLATLQILQNKEETVRVQAESLAVAESRIAALNARHTDLRREIDRKEREIQTLRKSLKDCRMCKVDSCDVSLTADIQETDDQKNIVATLQSNLDVIEDLYRECFYESVKQENLIEILRKSYLDVRLMDKEKCDRISKLHNVINTQKWSLDRCQDIATEVDNLKMEISNFINSSNNDSGMWEESVVGGLSEDLQDIAAQLLRLRDLLAGDCTCGLEQENKRLTQENESMKGEICNLRTQISDLTANLRKKDCLDRQCKEEIETKERELNCIRGQLRVLAEDTKAKSACNDTLMQQLTETKAVLDDKAKELCCLQKHCCVYEDTIKVMKEELNKSEDVIKEKESLRKELSCVSRRCARVQRRAAELEAELARARDHCDRVDAAYREKTSNAAELEQQLDSAHARGAALCAEAGRVVRAARCWAARMRDIHREQEKQIKQKECTLQYIQDELHKRQVNICPRVFEQTEYGRSARRSASETRSRTSKRSENSCPTVTFGERESRHDGTGSSGSEMVSCSSSTMPLGRDVSQCVIDVPSCSTNVPHCSVNVPSCSVNVPPCLPQRTCKKLSDYGLKISPSEEMFSRMESLSAALADGYKRWSRRAPT